MFIACEQRKIAIVFLRPRGTLVGSAVGESWIQVLVVPLPCWGASLSLSCTESQVLTCSTSRVIATLHDCCGAELMSVKCWDCFLP